jgi:beta-glucosidase
MKGTVKDFRAVMKGGDFRVVMAVLSILVFSIGGCSRGKNTDRLPFRNSRLSLEERLDDLMGRLTIEEKISQLMMHSPSIPRLGVPAFNWWGEALHGLAKQGAATVFPQAIALAATWNPELHRRIGDVIATEARAKNNAAWKGGEGRDAFCNNLSLWSPNINIFRDPRWGRGQETYGEDPFLTARFATAFVQGLQGNDPRYLKCIATLKHYAVHSGPEPERHCFNARVSERDLRETYLPAFEAGVHEGHVGEVMSAYNAVNGIPVVANKELLTGVLRDEWGFQGAVVGDVDNVADLIEGHHFTSSLAGASAAALKAGNDLCSGSTYVALREAMGAGLVSVEDVNRSLRRLLRLRFRLGQFDSPKNVPYASILPSENDSHNHEQMALEASRQSLVLLKNDGILPWDPKELKTVAVLGPTAEDPFALTGNYAGTPVRPVTILDGIRSALEPKGITVLSDPAVPLVDGMADSTSTFPGGVLFTDDRQSIRGLRREILSGENIQGISQTKSTDSQIDFFWNPAQPLPGIPLKGASIRWSGVLIPLKSGSYLLGVSYLGSVKLLIDGKEVLTKKGGSAGGEGFASGSVRLEAGRVYSLSLEYNQRQGGSTGRIRLGWLPPGGMDQAEAIARKADHIVLSLGITPKLEGEEMKLNASGFKGGDRTSILLPKVQRELLAAVAALGKPVTVVLTGGSALSFDTAKANAVLEAWYYGEQGGRAVAEALVGKYNPGGRLPVTFYASDQDIPPFTDYSMINRTYRYFKGRPLFAFGHGLSYTTFDYSEPRLSRDSVSRSGEVICSVTITNTGLRAGDEVVQVYAHSIKQPVAMPIQWLVGFQRISLLPGESKRIEIPIKAESLRRWDPGLRHYVVDPGQYELRIGSASDHIMETLHLTVGG